jgi:putative transposase
VGINPCYTFWAEGVYSGLRAEQTKLCYLVSIGVNKRGEKHFLAIEDGVRESTQSWREVLLNLKSRGMNMPKLASAMGLWASGQPWRKCFLKPVSNSAGYTKP